MLKNLISTIKGYARGIMNSNTNVAILGRERIREVKQALEAALQQRDSRAADGILLEDEIDRLNNDITGWQASIKDQHAQGNKDSAERAYNQYLQCVQRRDAAQARLTQIQNDVTTLDKDIDTLKSQIEQASDRVEVSAGKQQTARASSAINQLRTELTGGVGGLADVMDSVDHQHAQAKATRQRLDSNDPSSLVPPKQSTALTMEQILAQNAES